MSHRFVIVDVFTDTPLTGNQLAVFTDADDIPDALLQPMAKEIGFSETVYVYARDRVRIFTPQAELPFAGHPVLGTAFALSTKRGVDVVELTTGRGSVVVTFARGRGRMVQPLPTVRPFDRDRHGLLAALGLGGIEALAPIDVYDNGVQHLFVVVASAAIVAGVTPDGRGLGAHGGGVAVNVCAPVGASRWKTRMFHPAAGVLEDPATGSAAGPLAVHACRHGLAAFGDELEISQGTELGRPSTLYAVARGTADRLDAVEVAGDSVIVGHGELDV